MLLIRVLLVAAAVSTAGAEEKTEPPKEEREQFGPATVGVRLHEDEEPIPYVHPGGPLEELDIRDFCKSQLKKEMAKNGIDSEGKDSLFQLLEGLWVTCRDMLREALPGALRTENAKHGVTPPAPSPKEEL
mmetsp:Transcript_21745/g.67003  ORF Transcript_21745/g.67003 Transcript_21745/m.67003 type:complete len:131 (-) Transcript_21745:106-498(-)